MSSSGVSSTIKAYAGKDANTKLGLPMFLKTLTTNSSLDMQNAMIIAGKVFKTHNTPEKLSMLNTVSLEQLGVSDKEHRKQTLIAITKVGWTPDLPFKSFISPPVSLKPAKVMSVASINVTRDLTNKVPVLSLPGQQEENGKTEAER